MTKEFAYINAETDEVYYNRNEAEKNYYNGYTIIIVRWNGKRWDYFGRMY